VSRLRQLHPQNYISSGNINAEIESIVRYLNAAELGNKTVGELLDTLFDSEGNFEGPIEFRKTDTAIEYRIGEYQDPEVNWQQLASIESLRGPAGRDVGTIGAPIFHGRAEFSATASQTVFDYAHLASDTIMVFRNGQLQRPGGSYDYTTSPTAGTTGSGAITFNAPQPLSTVITAFKVRSTAETGFVRVDVVNVVEQSVFGFANEDTDVLLVYKNGILQREGALYDYTRNAFTDTITFNSPVPIGALISFITVIDTSETPVVGLMSESTYCSPTTGLIRFDKLSIPAEAISASKVAGLSLLMAEGARLTVSATTPASAFTGKLWLDTSKLPNALRFYDGTQWFNTSPESTLPSFQQSNALQVVRVNGTGTALEYAPVDLSGVISLTQRGSINGVATLDNTARLPANQLPATISTTSYFWAPGGALVDGTYVVHRLFSEKVSIKALSARLASGTATMQLAVNGVAIGPTYALSSTPVEIALATPIDIDASASSRALQIIITAASSANGPEVTLAGSIAS
jgi:hypothetical protein